MMKQNALPATASARKSESMGPKPLSVTNIADTIASAASSAHSARAGPVRRPPTTSIAAATDMPIDQATRACLTTQSDRPPYRSTAHHAAAPTAATHRAAIAPADALPDATITCSPAAMLEASASGYSSSTSVSAALFQKLPVALTGPGGGVVSCETCG